MIWNRLLQEGIFFGFLTFFIFKSHTEQSARRPVRKQMTWSSNMAKWT